MTQHTPPLNSVSPNSTPPISKPKPPPRTMREAINQAQAPPGVIADYKRQGDHILQAAGDAKAEKNFALYGAIRTECRQKNHGLHQFLLTYVQPEPANEFRTHPWYSASKGSMIEVCTMKWTHLLNTFGLLIRAIGRKEGVTIHQYQVTPEFLAVAHKSLDFRALFYEIAWRLEYGRFRDSTLCMSHAEVEHRFGTASDDFFYHEDE